MTTWSNIVLVFHRILDFKAGLDIYPGPFLFPLIKQENSHFPPLFPLLAASFSHLEINSLIMNT